MKLNRVFQMVIAHNSWAFLVMANRNPNAIACFTRALIYFISYRPLNIPIMYTTTRKLNFSYDMRIKNRNIPLNVTNAKWTRCLNTGKKLCYSFYFNFRAL